MAEPLTLRIDAGWAGPGVSLRFELEDDAQREDARVVVTLSVDARSRRQSTELLEGFVGPARVRVERASVESDCVLSGGQVGKLRKWLAGLP